MHVTSCDPWSADPRFQKKQECLGDEYFWGTGSAFDEDMAACMQCGSRPKREKQSDARAYSQERSLITMLLSKALASDPCLQGGNIFGYTEAPHLLNWTFCRKVG